MATRSFIAIKDGSVSDTLQGSTIYKDVYCHNDGYLSYNGFILKNYYNTIERVNSLIELGDLSYLGQRLSKFDTHQFTDELITFAYGRDRGEDGTFARVYNDESKLRIEEYTYLFKDGVWHWRTDKDKTFRVLTDSDIEDDK